MSSASELSSPISPVAPAAPAIRPLTLRENFAWTLPANLVYAACQWGILVVLARIGSTGLVGLYVLGLSVTAPIFVCASLQLRAIQATDTRGDFTFGDYLGLRLIATAVALLVAGGIAWGIGYRDAAWWAVMLLALAKAFESISDVIYGLLQQKERMDRVARSKALHGVALLAGVCCGAIATGEIVGAVAGLVAARLLVLVACDVPSAAWIARSGVGEALRPRWRPSMLRGLVALGLPLAVVTVLISLETNIPRYFVTHQLGVAELGLFGAIAALITAGGMFTRSMNQVASPRLAAMFHSGDRAGFRRLLGRILACYLVLGLLGLAMVPLMGRWLLGTLFGADFSSHVDLLLVVMLAAAVAYQSGALTTAMISIRAIRSQLPLRLATVAVSLVGCLLLMPRWGLLGAGMALVAAKLPFVIASLLIVLRATRAGSALPEGD
jgi:O-antigen/teichoic acid export membrane protein